MRVDLLAGTAYSPCSMPDPIPTILMFDSGLGGLTVLAEAMRARPDARFVYAADDAGFPYGRLSESVLLARVIAVMERLVAAHRPDIVVIACNTASTLVLPHLRERFSVPVVSACAADRAPSRREPAPLPFVGTVPAIKPAAQVSLSKRITVLATPGTVARDYTRDLVETYAAGCKVNLVGSQRLAGLCEAELCGAPVPDEEIAAEIAPCFVDDGEGRTDVIVLACTHYPLLLPRFQALAPWPVAWIDPAPAIARRMVQLIGAPVAEANEEGALAVFTGGAGVNPALRGALAARGLSSVRVEPMPLGQG